MTSETSIGIIGLDTVYTKMPGHLRNQVTFGFPVIYEVVPGATPQRAVVQADPTLLKPFIRAAQDLEARGARAITTACGFLALFQQELADAVSVPLFSSSLTQLPMIYQMIRSGHRIGVLTANKSGLTRRHLAAVGAESVPICVVGMEDQPEFREVILETRRPDLDIGRFEQELLDQASRLVREYPDIDAILLECTDLVPFAYGVQACTGLPVFDIVTLIEMMHASLTRHPYGDRAAPLDPAPALVDPAPALVDSAPALLVPAPALLDSVLLDPAPALLDSAPALLDPVPLDAVPGPSDPEPLVQVSALDHA
jgi:Asp/Glu/hydantoin racemase